MAAKGILMAPISWSLVASLLAVVVVFLISIDGLKVRIFRGVGIR
jgi:hypothetical protein